MAKKYKYSTFTGFKSAVSNVRDTTAKKLIEFACVPNEGGKYDEEKTRGFCRGNFKENWRNNPNILNADLLFFDVDSHTNKKKRLTPEKAHNILLDEGINHFIYTSSSHNNDDKIKFRIVIFMETLLRGAKNVEYMEDTVRATTITVWEHFFSKFNTVYDNASKTLSQVMYLSYPEKNKKHFDHYFFIKGDDGNWIEMENSSDEVKEIIEKDNKESRETEWDKVARVTNWDASGKSRYDALRDLAYMKSQDGMAHGKIIEDMKRLMRSVPEKKRDSSWDKYMVKGQQVDSILSGLKEKSKQPSVKTPVKEVDAPVFRFEDIKDSLPASVQWAYDCYEKNSLGPVPLIIFPYMLNDMSIKFLGRFRNKFGKHPGMIVLIAADSSEGKNMNTADISFEIKKSLARNKSFKENNQNPYVRNLQGMLSPNKMNVNNRAGFIQQISVKEGDDLKARSVHLLSTEGKTFYDKIKDSNVGAMKDLIACDIEAWDGKQIEGNKNVRDGTIKEIINPNIAITRCIQRVFLGDLFNSTASVGQGHAYRHTYILGELKDKLVLTDNEERVCDKKKANELIDFLVFTSLLIKNGLEDDEIVLLKINNSKDSAIRKFKARKLAELNERELFPEKRTEMWNFYNRIDVIAEKIAMMYWCIEFFHDRWINNDTSPIPSVVDLDADGYDEAVMPFVEYIYKAREFIYETEMAGGGDNSKQLNAMYKVYNACLNPKRENDLSKQKAVMKSAFRARIINNKQFRDLKPTVIDILINIFIKDEGLKEKSVSTRNDKGVLTDVVCLVGG